MYHGEAHLEYLFLDGCYYLQFILHQYKRHGWDDLIVPQIRNALHVDICHNIIGCVDELFHPHVVLSETNLQGHLVGNGSMQDTTDFNPVLREVLLGISYVGQSSIEEDLGRSALM